MRRQIKKIDERLVEVWASLPANSADAMNERFRRVGMGAPIDADARAGQVQSLVQTEDGNEDVVGAAYAHLWDDLEKLLAADENTPSGRVHLLKAVWVDDDLRFRGFSRELVNDVRKTALQHGAEHLVAKVGAIDSITQRWLEKLGFTIFAPEADLRVGGVTVPVDSGAVFAWLPLVAEPAVAVVATS